MPSIKAEANQLFAGAGETAQTKIIYDGSGEDGQGGKVRMPARVFQRKFGDKHWTGPLDLKQTLKIQGVTDQDDLDEAKVSGSFKTDQLKPGTIIQYGILAFGLPLDPTKEEISDDRFDKIATVFVLLKQPSPWTFTFSDENNNTGGTFHHRQINTQPTKTVMVLQIGELGEGLAFQDQASGMWRLTKVEHTRMSGWDPNHDFVVTPLWPGNIYWSTILLIDEAGHWQSWAENFRTLKRTVRVEFTELDIVNDGDPNGKANCGFLLRVHEGAKVIEFSVPEQEVFDRQVIEFDAGTHFLKMGPKQINEDNQEIAVSVFGYDEDGWLGNERAASNVVPLSIPIGPTEIVINSDRFLDTTRLNGDFQFMARVKHSVDYT
jgi:hypothetical protein